MNLETLEKKFREAKDEYAKDKSDANHDKYRKAKLRFTDARREQKQAEENDENHPRGKGLVVVTNGEDN